MASTSLADPNLPTAVAADQVIMSGNQAQPRDPHTRDNLKRDKNGFPRGKSRPSFCAPPVSGRAVVEAVGQATVLLVRDEANANAVGWKALGRARSRSRNTPERLNPGKLLDM